MSPSVRADECLAPGAQQGFGGIRYAGQHQHQVTGQLQQGDRASPDRVVPRTPRCRMRPAWRTGPVQQSVTRQAHSRRARTLRAPALSRMELVAAPSATFVRDDLDAATRR
jgi:hypothetical protein